VKRSVSASALIFFSDLKSLFAADIISSAVSPSWEKVGMLAAIVGVRTVLSYFLRMELKQGVALIPSSNKNEFTIKR